MNADLSIHRMAFREAETLGLAQALVVKKRQELELRILRERVLEGTSPAGAGMEGALRRMEDQTTHNQTGDAIERSGALVDKTA